MTIGSLDSLNLDSVNQLCGNANQLVVYGFADCQYRWVRGQVDPLIRQANSIGQSKIPCCGLRTKPKTQIKSAFDYQIKKTLEGRTLGLIESPNEVNLCKNVLNQLILENYKRVKEGKELIPLIFCVDISENRYAYNTTTVTIKSERKVITSQELRRYYKLLYDLGDDALGQELSLIARKTIKFVKLEPLNKSQDKTEWCLKEITPFTKEAWREAMEKRRQGREPKKAKIWIDKLKKAARDYQPPKTILSRIFTFLSEGREKIQSFRAEMNRVY